MLMYVSFSIVLHGLKHVAGYAQICTTDYYKAYFYNFVFHFEQANITLLSSY
jgi:hypothetical protein